MSILLLNYSDLSAQISTATVTIYPVPTLTAPPDATYCYNTTTTVVNVSGTPVGVTFDISGGVSIGLANATGVTAIPSFTVVNAGNTPITSTITLTPSANGCIGTPVTFDITVLPEITMTDPTDLTACNGTTVTGTTFVGAPATSVYNWTNTNPSIGLAGSGTGDIASFTGTNTNCTDNVGSITVIPQMTVNLVTCPGTQQVFTITIFPTPDGTLAGSAVCIGTDAELTFTSTCGTGPFDLEISADDILAPFDVYNGITSGTPFDITPDPIATTTYNLMQITDANGCVNP